MQETAAKPAAWQAQKKQYEIQEHIWLLHEQETAGNLTL